MDASPDAITLILQMLAAQVRNDDAAILAALEQAGPALDPVHTAALFRSAIFHAAGSGRYLRQVHNIWTRLGRPPLKSTQTNLTIEVLSDETVEGIRPFLELMLAAYGINARIEVGPYDSVEHAAFAGQRGDADITLVTLSDRWVRRLVTVVPATGEDVERAAEQLQSVIHGLAERRTRLAFTSFVPGGWPPAAFLARSKDRVSWAGVYDALNSCLRVNDVLEIDLQTALHLAGGQQANGRVSAVRLRAPFEEAGFVALAREFAAVVAHAFGRSHRALLTDWDNTLWGGEVGELGFLAIRCGRETTEGYGYHLLQTYIRDLAAIGVLIAGVSRNDPSAAGVLDSNPHLVLRAEHFAALKLSWGNKSEAVSQIVPELGFGADLMVYLDDNHVDLAEVLVAHPEIDIVLAGPEPDQSLSRLVSARLFNSAALSDTDLQRSSRATSLRQGRSETSAGMSVEAFRQSLGIVLNQTGLNADNRDRVLQLLQKTNQFNLTTRRHNAEDVAAMLAAGGQLAVFDYADRFGPQGIIGLMILMPTPQGNEIDTWLMSCRVLNRGVEEMMLAWARDATGQGVLAGRYIATSKNGLVADLYSRLGFVETADQPGHYSSSAGT